MALLISSAGAVMAQNPCPNVDLEAVSIDPATLSVNVGATTQIFVVMKNNGPCPIPTGEATCLVTLSSTAFDLGSPFNFNDICGIWTYLGDVPNATSHNLFFRNNAGPINLGTPCYFQFDVKGKTTFPGSPITLVSSLSATASTGDVQPANQSALTFLTVNPAGGPLPLKILSFTGLSKNCENVLSWKTTEEKNVKSIEVERSSDARTYLPVYSATVRNSSMPTDYSFTDNAAGKTNYYRLKITDTDGKFVYSEVVTLSIACKAPIATIYPNPMIAHQTGTVYIQNFGTKVYGYLMDLSGKQLEKIKLMNGTNNLSMANYAAGTYILKVLDENNQTESLKVVLSR